MNKEEIESVKHIDMQKYFVFQGISVTRDWKSKCLWHEPDKNPSLKIYPDHVHCFSCKKSADIISFTMTFLKLSFKEAVLYLKRHAAIGSGSSTREREDISFSHKKVSKRTFDECLSDYRYMARWNCLQRIHEYLKPQTKEMIISKKVPDRIFKWAEKRGYDGAHFLDLTRSNDVLFLDDARALSKYVREKEPSWKESGLFHKDGSLIWFSYDYCIVFTVWDLYTNEFGEKDLRLTSMRLRNTSKHSTKAYPKDVELPAPPECTASFGWMFLKSQFEKYPQQIADGCRSHTVLICEGATTAIACMHIFGEFIPNLLVLSTGTVEKSSQDHNVRFFRNCEKFLIGFDNDLAGETGIRHVMESALKIGINYIEAHTPPQEFNDWNDYLKAKNEGRIE